MYKLIKTVIIYLKDTCGSFVVALCNLVYNNKNVLKVLADLHVILSLPNRYTDLS